MKHIHGWRRLAISLTLCAAVLSGCTPRFDWREVRATDGAYSVLLPAKPASMTRAVNLDGLQVNMAMTAAEVDGVTFAVGAASVPQAGAAAGALSTMKLALVRNIEGTVKLEKILPAGVEIDAAGKARGRDVRLRARFIAVDRRIYQVLVVGPRDAMPPEDALDTFFSSFKPV